MCGRGRECARCPRLHLCVREREGECVSDKKSVRGRVFVRGGECAPESEGECLCESFLLVVAWPLPAFDPGIEFRVEGLGFRVWGVGFRVQDLGFRIQGLGSRV